MEERRIEAQEDRDLCDHDDEDRPMATLVEQVRELARLRAELAQVKADVAFQRARFLSENSGILAREEELAQAAEAVEKQLRTEAAKYAATTGDMKGIPGVECKRYKTLAYDEAQALEWAIAHGIGVKLDRDEFEAVVFALRPEQRHRHGVPVLIREEVRATIARDLGKALGVAELTAEVADARD